MTQQSTPYDLEAGFYENMGRGFVWNKPYPDMSKLEAKYTLFGERLYSLFGIAANPLTHGARSIEVCSKLGYDIITYRSVRSREWKGQPYPHWRYVNIDKQLTVEDLSSSLHGGIHSFPEQDVSMVNSFGIQSLKPEQWQQDFEIAKKSLRSGQLLILALMFTPEEGGDVVEDAGLVASYAKETSAKVFEINLAHPNSGMKSLVYEDVDISVAICKKVKLTIGDRPLIAKVGYYKDTHSLKEFMKQTRGILSGIASTNTYGMSVVDEKGRELFPGRPKAGVSGAAIRSLSMEQAKTIADFKKELRYDDFVVIGIGGVTKPEHIDQYLALGANAVQTAVGAYADPLLASKYSKIL